MKSKKVSPLSLLAFQCEVDTHLGALSDVRASGGHDYRACGPGSREWSEDLTARAEKLGFVRESPDESAEAFLHRITARH